MEKEKEKRASHQTNTSFGSRIVLSAVAATVAETGKPNQKE